MTTTNRNMLLVREAGRRFDVATRELYRLIDEGRLSGFRDERMVVVPEDELEELAASGIQLAPWQKPTYES